MNDKVNKENKKTAQNKLQRSKCYCLTALCGGLNIYLRFSQSVT